VELVPQVVQLAGTTLDDAKQGAVLKLHPQERICIFEYELANIAGMHIGGIGALVLSSMKRMSMKRKSMMASPCPFIVRLAEQVASGWGFLKLFCQ